MRTLRCRDLSFHCDYESSGETIQEVIEQMIDHIEEKHLEEWARMVNDLNIEEERDLLMRRTKDDNRTPI